jgi:hypothetical protein
MGSGGARARIVHLHAAAELAERRSGTAGSRPCGGRYSRSERTTRSWWASAGRSSRIGLGGLAVCGIGEGVTDILDFREDDGGVSWIHLSPDGKPGNIAHARLWMQDNGEIWLTDVDVPTSLERTGRGRQLINLVRRVADDQDLPAYTYGSTPGADGFYVAVGCIWRQDREEFLIAPVDGAPVLDQLIYRKELDGYFE